MRVLVTVGSKRGGTEGLGGMAAEDLREEGFEVDLKPPKQVHRLDGYDAVVVGVRSTRATGTRQRAGS